MNAQIQAKPGRLYIAYFKGGDTVDISFRIKKILSKYQLTAIAPPADPEEYAILCRAFSDVTWITEEYLYDAYQSSRQQISLYFKGEHITCSPRSTYSGEMGLFLKEDECFLHILKGEEVVMLPKLFFELLEIEEKQ
jgi:hypothetical protein